MQLQIRSIVLWPRHAESAPRVVTFEFGRVNLITGASKTGKSAIIPIIDYCLGAEKCTIPVGPIREACSWFGVVLKTSHGLHLLARREPGDQQSTGDMYLQEGDKIEVPAVVEKNTTIGAVKSHLDELAGLTRLDFDLEGTSSGFKGRPSFRDMSAFMFQPQNVVANPSVLFYKADSHEHREKLRTIFPYVLGAVTPEVLALQHEARRVQTELARKEREFEKLSAVSRRWTAELRSRLVTARELGLVEGRLPQDLDIGQMLERLRLLLDREVVLDVQLSGISEATDELVQVEKEEATVSRHLGELRTRLQEMTRLREAGDEYRQTLEVKLDRLSLADWMLSMPQHKRACPVCGSSSEADLHEVDELAAALRRVEGEFGVLSRIPASFDREQQRVREEVEVATEQLGALRIRRAALTQRSAQIRDREFTQQRVARFIGGLSEALEQFEALREDGDLAEELSELRSRLDALRSRISESSVRNAINRALSRFSLYAQRIVPVMDVERPNDPIFLSIKDLTLRIGGETREDYLWEIGSGANWVAYHVATIIALHQLFRGLQHTPVPSIAVFDQPSQVYFPRPALAHAPSGEDEPPEDPILRDEDTQAVRLIFAVLSAAALDAQGNWQAIVLDHAGESVYSGLEGLHLVEEWRDGRKLVPADWIGRTDEAG